MLWHIKTKYINEKIGSYVILRKYQLILPGYDCQVDILVRNLPEETCNEKKSLSIVK